MLSWAGLVWSDLVWSGLLADQCSAKQQLNCLKSISHLYTLCSSLALECLPLFLTNSVPLKSLHPSLLLFKTCTSSPPLVVSSVRLTGVFQSAPSSVVSALPRESPFPISRSLSVKKLFCALKQIHFRDYPNALWKI